MPGNNFDGECLEPNGLCGTGAGWWGQATSLVGAATETRLLMPRRFPPDNEGFKLLFCAGAHSGGPCILFSTSGSANLGPITAFYSIDVAFR